ncbi:4-hydroxythreonine-4-phosphate dehydrogenase PdxA [Amylibacter sp. SFDW26]|uniref:4-hydroxythreonine-4-phosphate dehydrogenase PdxA n=1 Tax=Amylibacter sp. SFDW26 TaxID=2652722 RepID=UPI001261EDAD|nr:4-hydroxythreonine-4-phosphate dehydrogenase PdxA [Amylibacter sp. SFDW26]KAB7615817.1 4-hydroxythreonine-4-phosphate dehydrogenase PdxA [Amylibacter sp. SFDW26]
MKQPVALTSGDPSGIGLEITGLAWKVLKDKAPFFLIADHNHVQAVTNIPTTIIDTPADAINVCPSSLPVLHIPFAEPPNLGKEQPGNAHAVIKSIEMAVGFTKSGQAAAVCTNPINKKVLKDGAAFPYPGHTEFLAHLGNVPTSVMMLTAPELRAVPVTIHIALSEVPNALTDRLIADTIRITEYALKRDFGLAKPRIAVAGLNPHAGEGGTMGTEEMDRITPLLEELRQEDIILIGPLPADTMFHPQAREKYDTAVCMYHDQALIPLKTLNFSAGVNTTLGLPFIRTSPDHGTAFDIAGKGTADATSLIEAIIQAHQMAQNRANYDNIS